MAERRELYQGYALQAVDRKGRVAVPNGLRAAIEKNAGSRVLMIGDDDRLPCMVAYDKAWSERLYDRLQDDYARAQAAGRDIDRTGDALHNFANVDEVAFDEAGRFILPPYVKERAGIDDFAFFAGNADTFHIWNPRRLIESTSVREGTRNRCAWLLDQRGGA